MLKTHQIMATIFRLNRFSVNYGLEVGVRGKASLGAAPSGHGSLNSIGPDEPNPLKLMGWLCERLEQVGPGWKPRFIPLHLMVGKRNRNSIDFRSRN